jgi:hypothetical protein
MKQTDLPHTNTPDAEWQLLGELDISVGSATDFTIDSRLTELLIPLDLSTDFKYRVMESVQDSVMRILQSNAVSTTGHIHLFIFAPYARILERKTWGFFHIERIENQTEVADTRDHAIDFYLYVEGQ